MESKTLILAFCAIFAFGFTGGFYLATAFQKQIEVLIGAAIVLAFLTWMGSGSEFFKLIREWYKEQKRLPKLSIEYDERDRDQYCPILRDTRIESYGPALRKLLRIRVLNSGGAAMGCEAILKVMKKPDFPNPTTEEKYLQWAKNNDTKIDIHHNKDAFLNIVFSMAPKEKSYVAFASRPKNLDGPKMPSSVDGFMIGDYDLKVKIMPENAEHLNLQFLLHVKEDWNELSMERIK